MSAKRLFEDKRLTQNQYYYLTVKYDEFDNGKTYCYISDDTSIKAGDKVVIYMVCDIVLATVVETKYYTKENAPYPIEKTKRIIEKVTEETDLAKYDIYYDNIDEYDDDDYVSAKELVEKENEINKLHKIIANINNNELSITRLMKILPVKNQQEMYNTLYYSPKLNLFINKVATDFYMLTEYDANLFKKKEYQKMIKFSIIVQRKLYDNKENKEEIYKDVVRFCIDNNIQYIDDFNE